VLKFVQSLPGFSNVNRTGFRGGLLA
jgi:hypothetical protein